jgi:pimeloyl-ACP methyl ester carboxylesterase
MSSQLLRRGFAVAGVVAALAALAYGGLLSALYFNQESMIFPATTLPADYQFRFDQRFEEIRVAVPDGSLDALLFRQANPRGLVFYLHGNGGDLTTWTTGLEFYRRINYDLFIFDYRGYGKSTGRIESEAQLHADVRAAWEIVAPRYQGMPIVLFGRSLGTALATRLATEVEPSLLVLVTPFTSLAASAKRHYPYAPEFLVKYPLPNDTVIGRVKSPVFLVAGARDNLTPLSDSERLKALARSPVELLVVDGAGHNDIHQFPAYLDGLADRLVRIGGG